MRFQLGMVTAFRRSSPPQKGGVASRKACQALSVRGYSLRKIRKLCEQQRHYGFI